MVMPRTQPRPGEWTLEDWRELPENGNRYEVLDGVLVVTPAPRLAHQKAVRLLYDRVAPAVRERAMLLWSPAEIAFTHQRVVQPDLFVAPFVGNREPRSWREIVRLLLAVEVLSPGTAARDRGIKRRIYQEHADEYWIVDLDGRVVERRRPGEERPEVLDGVLAWRPPGADAPLAQRLQRALGPGYELRELLGRGGFGVVYAAWERDLEREVAVKALRHDLFPTAELLERFRREARAVAKLRHPNIVPIFAVGEGEGLAFMTMPRVSGESLLAVLARDGSMEVEPALRIAVGAARALETAHAAGVVHRDVKPENVMLEGPERRVALMDFGIARTADAGAAITGTGLVIGTPAYMSPEQARGDRDVDHRSDIYAVGVVTYEMLAGALPFRAATFGELVYLHATAEPPPLRAARPDVPPDAEAAIMRCLAKTPAERWQSAGELADTLRRCACL
jgi:Uma2 family endonuclease